MTASVTSFSLWTGDIATDKYDNKLYKVVKVNPKNIKCIGEDGRTWNVPFTRLREATPEEEAKWEESHPASQAELIRLGHVVKFRNPTNAAQKGLFVVIKQGVGTVNLAYLGGNIQSKYFRGVPEDAVEKTDGPLPVKNV
jgi:hypothetical protein